MADKLLLQEGKRIRLAGGIPFNEEGGLGSTPNSRAGSLEANGSRDEDQVAGVRERDVGQVMMQPSEQVMPNMPEPVSRFSVNRVSEMS